MPGGLAQGLGQEDGCGPDPDPGHGGQDLVKRVGLHQGLDLGGDIGPLSVQGDELPGQVRKHHCGGVGAGDHHALVLQGRDDLAGPGGVPPAPVGLELGVNPYPACALKTTGRFRARWPESTWHRPISIGVPARPGCGLNLGADYLVPASFLYRDLHCHGSRKSLALCRNWLTPNPIDRLVCLHTPNTTESQRKPTPNPQVH